MLIIQRMLCGRRFGLIEGGGLSEYGPAARGFVGMCGGMMSWVSSRGFWSGIDRFKSRLGVKK